MITFLISLIGGFIIAALFRGFYNEDEDYEAIFFFTIVLTLFTTIIGIVVANQLETTYTSKVKVNPKLEITTKIDDNTSKSDTVYIYTFKKE